MKVTVNEDSASKRQIEVVVEAKRVEGSFQKAFKKHLKNFSLPGFRRGKVPANMAQRYITDAGLVRDVVEDIVPQAFSEATQEKSIKPISEPEWELVQNERGKDLIFKASFQISPLLKITDYTSLDVSAEREEIKDEHILDTLKQMQDKHAYFESVSEGRAIKEGDFVTVDYTSFQDGVEVKNGSVTNYMMEMKNDSYIPGFVENLIGLKAGDKKTFEISFPEDYANKELAGKAVTFQFSIHNLKEKKLPELDDDFASSHSTEETLAELKASIHKRLEKGAQQQAEGQVLTKIIKTLLEQVREEDIPPTLRQQIAQKIIQNRMYEMAQHGLSLEQVLSARGSSQEEWLKEMLDAGLYEARLEVLYNSVAHIESISVDETEIDSIIAAEAPSYKLKPKQLKVQMVKNGGIEMLRAKLLAEKVQKFLLEQAKVSYLKPGQEEQAPQLDSAQPGSRASSSPQEKKSAPRASKKKPAAEQPNPDASEEPQKKAPARKPRAAKKASDSDLDTAQGD